MYPNIYGSCLEEVLGEGDEGEDGPVVRKAGQAQEPEGNRKILQ